LTIWRRLSAERPAGDGRSRRKGWELVGLVDWPITHVFGLGPNRRRPIAVANFLSRLGDGPIYVVIIAALLLFQPPGTVLILACALASIAVLHSVYPYLKRATARLRPRDLSGGFPDSHPALDKFSFPSGHVMTLTAALTPIVYVTPRTWPIGVAAWAAMAWSRVAIGQHFATDIAAGTLLGAAVSGMLTYLILA
jgi:undecaprenyl-diphosphatase